VLQGGPSNGKPTALNSSGLDLDRGRLARQACF